MAKLKPPDLRLTSKSLGRDGERDSAERAWGSIEQLPFFQHGDGDKDVAENRI